MLVSFAVQKTKPLTIVKHPASIGFGQQQSVHRLDTDQFNKTVSTANALNNPLFQKLGLTCTVGTEADLPEVLASVLKGKKEGDGLSGLTQKQWLQKHMDVYKKWAIQNNKYPDEKTRTETFKALETAITNAETMDDAITGPAILAGYKKRFLKTPGSTMLLLRDKSNKVIAHIGINPFQTAHDLIEFDIHDIVDPKHGLIAGLRVTPEYRNKGVATTLKKTAIRYAHNTLGYRYLHSPTQQSNSSHRINQKLGYRPWRPETRFDDTPSITPELVKELINNYNIGDCQLCWIDTRSIK